MDDRIQRTIDRLKALDLVGDSNERLSAICTVLYQPEYGWTRDACEKLRQILIDWLEQFDPEDWADEYLAEQGLVRLPKDAEGETIHVGDEMDFSEGVRGLTVLGIGTSDDNDSDMGVYVFDDDGYTWFNARFLRHHRPTFEDVVRDMLNDVVCTFDASGGCSAWMTDTKVTEYADRLRELMADE